MFSVSFVTCHAVDQSVLADKVVVESICVSAGNLSIRLVLTEGRP